MRTGIELWTSPRFRIDVFFLREDYQGFCLTIFSNTFSLSCEIGKHEFGHWAGYGWYRGTHPAEVARLAKLRKEEEAKAERKARRIAKSGASPR